MIPLNVANLTDYVTDFITRHALPGDGLRIVLHPSRYNALLFEGTVFFMFGGRLVHPYGSSEVLKDSTVPLNTILLINAEPFETPTTETISLE